MSWLSRSFTQAQEVIIQRLAFNQIVAREVDASDRLTAGTPFINRSQAIRPTFLSREAKPFAVTRPPKRNRPINSAKVHWARQAVSCGRLCDHAVVWWLYRRIGRLGIGIPT